MSPSLTLATRPPPTSKSAHSFCSLLPAKWPQAALKGLQRNSKASGPPCSCLASVHPLLPALRHLDSCAPFKARVAGSFLPAALGPQTSLSPTSLFSNYRCCFVYSQSPQETAVPAAGLAWPVCLCPLHLCVPWAELQPGKGRSSGLSAGSQVISWETVGSGEARSLRLIHGPRPLALAVASVSFPGSLAGVSEDSQEVHCGGTAPGVWPQVCSRALCQVLYPVIPVPPPKEGLWRHFHLMDEGTEAGYGDMLNRVRQGWPKPGLCPQRLAATAPQTETAGRPHSVIRSQTTVS